MKMAVSLSQAYSKFDYFKTSSLAMSTLATNCDNQQWDIFLASSPGGHFYQTSAWAQVRKIDGWQPLIHLIMFDDKIVGGFQMLWRSKHFLGKIGIMLKGPVIRSDDPAILSFTLNTIKEKVKHEGLRALIIQPPDNDSIMENLLNVSGFSTNHLDSIIKNNTVCVDLQGSEEEVFKRIKRQKRQNIHTAINNGVMIREGTQKDLRTFFDFMTQTCRRHQVKPSPSKLNFLTSLWDMLESQGRMKLFMAQHAGEDVSGLIVLPFGETAHMWKFGWSGKAGHVRPNELLFWEVIRWGKNHGYRFADIGGVNATFAEAVLHNHKPEQIDAETKEYRFKSEFGGKIISLSNGFIYFPNPMIRWAYNLLMPYINSKPILKNRLLFSSD